MFPLPIEKRGRTAKISYRVAIIIALLMWLLPLLAVMLTSIRSIADINAGNYWGVPSSIQFVKNYTDVFTTTPMGQYLINSILIAVPAAMGAVILSTLAGFALAKYQFKANIWIFALFIGGNFVPFQILMIPVRDLSMSLGIYDTRWALIFFHVAFQAGSRCTH